MKLNLVSGTLLVIVATLIGCGTDSGKSIPVVSASPADGADTSVGLPARIEEVCARAAETGGRQGLDQHFLRQLYRQIIDEACAMEDRLIEKNGQGR